MNIRPVQPGDREQLEELWRYKESQFWPFAFTWKDFWDHPKPHEHWLVAEGARIWGSVRYAYKRDDRRYVHEIVTARAARQTGIGRLLLAAVGGQIFLKTNVTNVASNAFYLRCGFRLTGTSRSRKGALLMEWERNGAASERTVHLEGMGLLGAMTAWHLARAGIRFTWHDTDEAFCAWPASAGIVLPNKEPGYARWQEILREGALPCVEKAAFWHSAKRSPHGGKPKAELVGPLRLSELPSIHLNVPEFVLQMRQAFEGCRSVTPPPAAGAAAFDHYVVSHGFHAQRTGYLWGWTAHATLSFSDDLWETSGGLRPSLALRKNRFQSLYCAPLAGTEEYVVGTAMVPQQKPKALPSVDKRVQDWKDLLEELTGTHVVRYDVGSPRQGWRPTTHSNVGIVELGGKLYLPPAGHSGVLNAPLYAEEIVNTVLGAAVGA